MYYAHGVMEGGGGGSDQRWPRCKATGGEPCHRESSPYWGDPPPAGEPLAEQISWRVTHPSHALHQAAVDSPVVTPYSETPSGICS